MKERFYQKSQVLFLLIWQLRLNSHFHYFGSALDLRCPRFAFARLLLCVALELSLCVGSVLSFCVRVLCPTRFVVLES